MISEDRQKQFAHILIDGLWGDELIDFDEDSEELVIRHAKQLIGQWVEEQGNIDNDVRARINNQKKEIHEGSAEWKVLYNKYYADEMARKGHK